MELQPYQHPYPPLWYPTHNRESVQYAARQGHNFVGLGPAAAVREHVDAYWRTWEAHRHDQGRLNGHVAAPKVGILRQVVVADTDEEALAVTRAAHGDWYHSITKLWHDHDDHSVDGLFAWEAATEFETVIFGSAARVREQIGRLVEMSSCNYVICAFRVGHLAAPANPAFPAAVCAGGNARLFRQRQDVDIGRSDASRNKRII